MNWSIIDLQGKTLRSIECDSLGELGCGLMTCRRKNGEKEGYIDKDGHQRITAQYDYAFGFDQSTGWATVVKKAGRKLLNGMIDVLGNEVLPVRFRRLDHPREGMAVFQPATGDFFGFMGLDGKERIPPKYDWASGFTCGMALVSVPNEEGYCLIDSDGNRVMDALHYAGGRADDGRPSLTEVESPFGLLLLENPKTGVKYVIDRSGKTLIEEAINGLMFTEVLGDLIQVYDKQTEKVGLIDIFGNSIVEAKYEMIRRLDSEYLELQSNEVHNDGLIEKFSLINNDGLEVLAMSERAYLHVGSNRLCFVERTELGDMCGFISLPSGKVVIQAKYRIAGGFREGFASVKTNAN